MVYTIKSFLTLNKVVYSSWRLWWVFGSTLSFIGFCRGYWFCAYIILVWLISRFLLGKLKKLALVNTGLAFSGLLVYFILGLELL